MMAIAAGELEMPVAARVPNCSHLKWGPTSDVPLLSLPTVGGQGWAWAAASYVASSAYRIQTCRSGSIGSVVARFRPVEWTPPIGSSTICRLFLFFGFKENVFHRQSLL
jgi:hypothetical protein